MHTGRFVEGFSRRRPGGAEWVERLRDSVHLWNALPLALAAVVLTAGGFWLGSFVSGDSAHAAASVRTIRMEGRVITKNGVRYVSTPPQVVRVRGRSVKVAAQTVPLSSAKATQLPGSTVLVATTVRNTSVATVVRTVTLPVTVTSPASTVTGPTTTVSNTITVPVISTVTVTIP